MTRPVGQVKIHGTHVRVWEEIRTGGCTPEYEKGFKREVFEPFIRFLRGRGWKVGRDDNIHKNYRCLSPSHRYCIKNRLEAELEISGRTIGLEMFQNVANVTHPHGGKYEFDKLKKMPYLLRKLCELERQKAATWLSESFGYEIVLPKQERGPGGFTAREWIDWTRAKDRWDGEELTPDDKIHPRYRETAEGFQLCSFDRVYFIDRRGRWLTGIVEHNINNMWWVVSGRYAVKNMASFDLHLEPPLDPRIPHRDTVLKLRRRRLEEEMGKAVRRNDFEKAAILRDLLFKGQQLFRVKNREKGWWAPQAMGYTGDRLCAGQFTEDELGVARSRPEEFFIEAINA